MITETRFSTSTRRAGGHRHLSVEDSGDGDGCVRPHRGAVSRTHRIEDPPTRPAGLQVAVLGPDGIGKSSLLDGLAIILAPAFTGVHRVHFRPGLERRRISGTVNEDPHGLAPRAAVASLAKLAFYTLDHIAGFALQTRPRIEKGELVLYDRHFADLTVDPVRYRYGASTTFARLAEHVIPRPDITLVLDAPVDVIHSRRREVSREETARQLDAYRALAQRRPECCMIDASGSGEAVLKHATQLIIDHVTRTSRLFQL